MPLKLKNFSIDKFNRDVNTSYDTAKMYEAWSDYRNNLQDFISSNIKDVEDRNCVAVLGAGSLNDIDIKYLCGQFDNVALFDADTKSIKEGVLRHNISDDERGKTNILQMDFTGAESVGFFSGLERLVKKVVPAQKIVEYIDEAVDKMTPEAVLEQYDAVISCPVYTQMLYTQIEVFLKILYEQGLYEYADLNRMLNAAYVKMPKGLERYNSLLISMLNRDGVAVVISDVVEMEKGGILYKKANRIDLANAQGFKQIEKIVKKNGIELAAVGLADLLSKTDKTNEAYLLWPFNDFKEYIVYTCAVKRRKR